MKYFTGCTALITGVTAGIGEAIAIELAPHAHTLILVARRTDRLQTLEQRLLRVNPRLVVHYRSVDLADEGQLDALTRWVSEDKLNVNLLINNAGLGDHGRFEGAEWDKMKRVIAVNITALTKLTWALLPMLRQTAPATIINISSIASFIPVPGTAVYAASKAFVTSLSEALRAELRGSGITVTTVCPGPVETEFGQVARRESEPHEPPPVVLNIPAAQVARESLIAAANKRARVVPGFLTAIAACIMCLLPMFVVRFLINRSPNL